VAQLSQRDRAAGCVSFGRNIGLNDSPLADSVVAEHQLDVLVVNLSCRCLSSFSFPVTSVNIAISHIPVETQILWATLCCKHYRSIFSHFDIIDHQTYRIW